VVAESQRPVSQGVGDKIGTASCVAEIERIIMNIDLPNEEDDEDDLDWTVIPMLRSPVK
jgi:hypothetical protein